MRNLLLIFTETVLFTCTLYAQENEISLKKLPLANYFQPSDYNGGIQNWSFDLDSSGLLYVANNYGLLEFDGKIWTNHLVPGSTKLRYVLVDRRNRIFIGAQGQIGYFFKKEWGLTFISLLDKLPIEEREIEEVWSIIELGEDIYFNTSNKLFRLRGEQFESIPLPGQIQRAFARNSKLIVQFHNKGLFEFDGSNFQTISGTDDLNEEVISILDDKAGFICFTSEGSVFKFMAEENNFEQLEVNQLYQSADFNTCVRLSTGDIAIGTQNEGVLILDGELNLKQQYSKNKGLENRTVLSLMQDDFNNLWVGLNNGINYLELSSPLSLINEDVGLEGTGYTAALNKGDIYLGTNNGLFISQKSDLNPYTKDYELIKDSEGQVYNISIVGDDIILNHHRGAYLVQNTSITQIDNVGSWEMIQTPVPELVLAGTYEGMAFFKKENNFWTKHKVIENLNESSRVMTFENDSTLWMTHGYKGVYLIEFDRSLKKTKNISFFGQENGFPSNLLISVYNLNGNVIFTSQSGIFKFNAKSRHFTRNEFLTNWLGNDHVSKITSNETGDIYYITNGEIGMLKHDSFGTYIKEQNVFKRINKLLSDDLENISILDNQNILIGAKEGFIHYDPKRSFKINDDFNVLIKNVEVQFEGDSSISIQGDFLNNKKIAKNQSMEFQYTSPYFDGFQGLEFSYRLVGFDASWSSWEKEATKEYTNLPAGNYSFQVKAKNIYDLESPVVFRDFKITPKWYQSSWAYMSYFTFGILVFGFISYIQDRRHKKEKKRLYQSKEEAIKEKDQELTQVSEKSRMEIEELKNEKLKSEIGHKNNQLASVTMHLLNKTEFVQSMRKRIEIAMSDEKPSRTELKRILKTIDKNLHEDDSWEHFSFHFDQVHGDFLKKISDDPRKLSPQETKLAAYLRMNMSSKEIANLMNISVRGVELARYRLRKRLQLEREQNLVDYLIHY